MPAESQPDSSVDTPREADAGIRRRAVVLVLVVGLFGVAVALSVGVVRLLEAVLGEVESGTTAGLVVSVAGLQAVGFGVGTAAVLWTREESWRTLLRVGDPTQWTAAYGAFVGLVLMSLTVVATLAFRFLGVEAAESTAGPATDPVFYLALFVLSTFVAVPMEEVFFRGILQRRLEDAFHPTVAIAGASLLFTLIHSSAGIGDGGELITAGLFFSFGVALGTSYYLTDDLLVPVIGHVIYNAVQILVRAAEVLL